MAKDGGDQIENEMVARAQSPEPSDIAFIHSVIKQSHIDYSLADRLRFNVKLIGQQ